jgi:Type II secretion system (T2SS), protein E, N-terminal domain
MSRRRIGELLLERGAVTQAQLQAGLKAQQETRQRLGVTLIRLGFLSEVALAQTIGSSLQIATVDLAQMKVEWAAVHTLRARFCEEHELFPFAIDGKGGTGRKVLVAMADPLNATAIEEIEFTTGLHVVPYVSTHSQVRAAILKFYHKDTVSLEAQVPTVLGEEIVSGPNLMPAQSKPKLTVAKDLDFLFGSEVDTLEKSEQRFWALMRVLQRKGLVTREEFLKEFESEGKA